MTSGTFVVLAEFAMAEEAMADFLGVAADDAEHSLRDEPGCLHFDVALDTETAGAVVLYEVYASREAFDDHLKTPHLARFREALSRSGVEEWPVRFFSRRTP
jgi:quinol monooxygenase YgiN